MVDKHSQCPLFLKSNFNLQPPLLPLPANRLHPVTSRSRTWTRTRYGNGGLMDYRLIAWFRHAHKSRCRWLLVCRRLTSSSWSTSSTSTTSSATRMRRWVWGESESARQIGGTKLLYKTRLSKSLLDDNGFTRINILSSLVLCSCFNTRCSFFVFSWSLIMNS